MLREILQITLMKIFCPWTMFQYRFICHRAQVKQDFISAILEKFIVEKFKKIGKIGFSVECLTAHFFPISIKTVKICV